jgi:hypothetical protein
MLGHMSRPQSETCLAASFALDGIGDRALRRNKASGRDAVQASNKSMELTIKSVTPFAYAKAAPLLLAAHARC